MRTPRDPDAQYCMGLVREHDLDRYLSTLLADDDRQRALFAIYAFDAEICNIAGQVSEAGLGEMRLQWWRDTIDAVFVGTTEEHPVARELQPLIAEHDLPRHLFTRLIDAHRFDLYDEPMKNLDALLAYQKATSTAITDLVARCMIGYDALELAFAIEQAGIARGMRKLLETLPQQIARKQCYIPLDLLNNHHLDSGHVLAAESSKGMQLVLTQLANQIRTCLADLRIEQGRLKKDVLPAFFPASLADTDLRVLSNPDRNFLKKPFTTSQLKMQWILFKKSLFERI